MKNHAVDNMGMGCTVLFGALGLLGAGLLLLSLVVHAMFDLITYWVS